METEYQHLLIETSSAGVQTISLNRPEKLNAVNVRLSEELPWAIEAAAEDDAVRVIVITGVGRGFCAGLDLDPANVSEERATENRNRSAQLDDLAWVGRWVLSIVGCPKPVIAAVNGPAAGAGLGLALSCDIRLMQAGVKVTTGYIRRGLSPDAGVSYFLPRLIGTSRATEMIMTARDIDSEEAERIGLVSRVLPAESFGEAVATYATQLAGGPPIALALTKRLLAASPDTDLTTQLKNELVMIKKCFTTEDVKEAMQAYLQKRLPSFKGR